MSDKKPTWGAAKDSLEKEAEKKERRQPPQFERIEDAAKRRGWHIGIWGPPASA